MLNLRKRRLYKDEFSEKAGLSDKIFSVQFRFYFRITVEIQPSTGVLFSITLLKSLSKHLKI